MGPPPDHRQAIRRAHWQPRTSVTDVNKGQHLQSRTNVWHANREKITNKKMLHVCTYNPQSISDLNRQDLDIMLVELENVKWHILGLSATQIKESNIEILPNGHHLFNSGNGVSRSNGIGFLVHRSIVPRISDYDGISDHLVTMFSWRYTFQHLVIQMKNGKLVF